MNMKVAFLLMGISLTASSVLAAETHSVPLSHSISVSGGYSVDDVVNKLNEKAEKLGAKKIRITSVGGNNHLFGTAVVEQ